MRSEQVGCGVNAVDVDEIGAQTREDKVLAGGIKDGLVDLFRRAKSHVLQVLKRLVRLHFECCDCGLGAKLAA